MPKFLVALAVLCALSSPAAALTAIDREISHDIAEAGVPISKELPAGADGLGPAGSIAFDQGIAGSDTRTGTFGSPTATDAKRAIATAPVRNPPTLDLGADYTQQAAESDSALQIATPVQSPGPAFGVGTWAATILGIGAVAALMRRRRFSPWLARSQRSSSRDGGRSGARRGRSSRRRRR